jgi:hypothetical protein
MSYQYVAIEPAIEAPILQGDLFKWIDGHLSRPWMTYGVVVTADCDLAKNKTRGRASYVPALTMEDYIWHHWKEGKFETAFDVALSTFTSRINNRLRKIGHEGDGITPQAALEWLERSGFDNLVDELTIDDNGQKRDLQLLVDEVQALSRLKSEKPDLKLLQECHRIKNKKKKIGSGDYAYLAADIQSSISSLPGDVFFLPLENSEPNDGLFLMLRHITQFSISNIATSVVDMTLGQPHAKRLGRIAAPYRYAITQNLARVFSDIGLPSSYESLRDGSSLNFFTRI